MTLYLDMDGVLVDYEGGIAASGFTPYPHGKQYIHRPREEWPPEMVATDAAYVNAMARAGFWHSLAPLPDAHLLWNFSRLHDHHVLTALPNRMDAHLERIAQEKRESIWWHFDPVFPDERMNLCLRHEKASFAKPGCVLVDDTPANCHEWEAAGGTAIHHTDATTTIKALRKLGYG
jgi:hypothetical protein